MKKKFLIGLMIAIMIFASSCQYIDKAIEDTFSTHPKKFNAEEDEKDKAFFDKIKGFFFDESNTRVFILDIESDAEDKMGFEFSMKMSTHIKDYIREHDIERYLSKEEIVEVLEKINETNLLLNMDKLNEIKDKLIQDIGINNPYVYQGYIAFYPNHLNIQLVNQDNPEHVDMYYYYQEEDEWKRTPVKISAKSTPMDHAIPLSEIPFESVKKIVDFSLELMKETGDYQEYDSINHDVGPYSIYTNSDVESLLFITTVLCSYRL